MGPFGNLLVLSALFAAASGLVLGVVGASRGHAGAIRWSRRLVVGFALLLIAANVAMEVALLQPDFSVDYVAHVGSRTAPTWVRIVSLWSSLEGSILFWGAMLGVYALAAVRTLRKHPAEEGWGLSVLHLCGTFFALVIAGPANPFGTVSPVPTDGPGPNPLLQNHILMVVHPPLLYSGYTGMVVPFALAVAALFTGRLGPAMLQSLRVWLLIPWILLTAGIVMGAWWAYEVLGWGGYWGWDPVENAPLLPWLTATAAIHGVMVIEKRNVLRGWTISLVVVTFLLTILGTFMTRSGVFNSVHAFAQSDIGPTFLTFLGFCLVGSIVLLSLRLGKLGPESQVEHAGSREGIIVVSNMVLILIMLTVLLGTVFPLVTEAIKGVQISVGEPYFNRMTIPMAVALLFLMGIGPALPWGRVSLSEARSRLQPPLIGAVALLALGLILGARQGWLLVELACAGFALQVTFAEAVRPSIARLRAGHGLGSALRVQLDGGRRRLGAYIAHFGLLLTMIAVGVSSTGKIEKDATLTTGQSIHLGAYQLTYLGAVAVQESNREALVAKVAVTRDGVPQENMEPRMNYYMTQREPVGTPVVRTGFREDLYLSAMSINLEGGTLGLRAFVNPMVGWIWIGAAIIALGALLAAFPRRAAATASARSRSSAVSLPIGVSAQQG
jgi:cytochrome c-type biogenesis protein CcmF